MVPETPLAVTENPPGIDSGRYRRERKLSRSIA
jgi:hypothetical protein